MPRSSAAWARNGHDVALAGNGYFPSRSCFTRCRLTPRRARPSRVRVVCAVRGTECLGTVLTSQQMKRPVVALTMLLVGLLLPTSGGQATSRGKLRVGFVSTAGAVPTTRTL